MAGLTAAQAFTEALSRASYCFADDTCRDWPSGYKHQAAAARIAVEAGWSDERIAAVHATGKHLVPIGDVLRDARKLREGDVS